MIISRRPVLERWVLGGVVLIAPMESTEILRLEGTAADLWSRLDDGSPDHGGPNDGGIEFDTLVSALATAYGIAPVDIELDVVDALDGLARADAVDRRPPEGDERG